MWREVRRSESTTDLTVHCSHPQQGGYLKQMLLPADAVLYSQPVEVCAVCAQPSWWWWQAPYVPFQAACAACIMQLPLQMHLGIYFASQYSAGPSVHLLCVGVMSILQLCLSYITMCCVMSGNCGNRSCMCSGMKHASFLPDIDIDMT